MPPINPTITILVSIILSGLVSFVISLKFWSSSYAATNSSGDFGLPSGGIFATIGGGLLMAVLMRVVVAPILLPEFAIGELLALTFVAGALGGFAGAFKARSPRNKGKNNKKS